LNAKADERKEERITAIGEVYRRLSQAPNEVAVSIDEMTGIQALARIAKDLPLAAGKPLAREFE
jgi:hypothetical protein